MAVNTVAMMISSIILIVVGFFLIFMSAIYGYYYQKQIADKKIIDNTDDGAKPWIWITLLVIGTLFMVIGIILLIVKLVLERNKLMDCKKIVHDDMKTNLEGLSIPDRRIVETYFNMKSRKQ